MKKLIAIVFLLSTAIFSVSAQQKTLQIGDPLGQISFDIIDGQTTQVFNGLKAEDKIIIMEFWGTYCGACINGMNHLADLKKEFGDQVTVWAINVEKNLPRVQKFIEARPYDFVFIDDHDEALSNLFPFRTIPHTVVVDQTGTIRAITAPENIESIHIKALLNNEPINLPLKSEDLTFDYQKDYFQADPATVRSFSLQPSIPGVGTFSKTPNEGPFIDRRISIHNQTIDGLYREAFQTTSHRLVYEVDESYFDYDKEENKYCLDFIVAPQEKADFNKIFQQKLSESFDVQARLEEREIDVVVLSKLPDTTVNLTKSTQLEQRYKAGGGKFKSNRATFSDFAYYLEDYGVVGKAVIDETQDDQVYDIDFSYQQEDPKTFFKSLKAMGLQVKKAKRKVEMLVLYLPNHNE